MTAFLEKIFQRQNRSTGAVSTVGGTGWTCDFIFGSSTPGSRMAIKLQGKGSSLVLHWSSVLLSYSCLIVAYSALYPLPKYTERI